jgi:hypothetical protein
LLIEFFDDGERWIKGKLDDVAGNRCLVGALRDIRDGHTPWCADPHLSAEGDAAIPEDRMDWTDFVHGELRELILQARKLAVADIEKH